MGEMTNTELTGCDADIQTTLGLLDNAIDKSGLAESTFCHRHFGDLLFRSRLKEGRVNIRVLRERYARLQRIVEELEAA